MSNTMADVIEAHEFEGDGFCRCQHWNIFEDGLGPHTAHIAEELTKAGFGSVRDAEADAFKHAAVNIETYPLAEQYHPARAHLANHFRTKAVAWRQS